MHKNIHTHAQSSIHVVWTIHRNKVKVLSWLKHGKGGGVLLSMTSVSLYSCWQDYKLSENGSYSPFSILQGSGLNTTESGWIYVYTSVLAFAGLYSSTSTLCETCGRSIWVLQKKQDFWMTACCNSLQYITQRLVSSDLLTTSCHQTAVAMTFNLHNYCLQWTTVHCENM